MLSGGDSNNREIMDTKVDKKQKTKKLKKTKKNLEESNCSDGQNLIKLKMRSCLFCKEKL
jgi:hypothetical protein